MILIAKQLTVSIDLYSMKKIALEVNGYYWLWLPTFFNTSSFVFIFFNLPALHFF